MMDEVRRYTATEVRFSTQGGSFVLEADFVAREAALREELTEAKNQAVNWRHTSENLNRQLIAAEQRNAELVELLRQIRDQAGKHHMSHSALNLKTQMANIHQKLDAALKPTESGASK